MHELPRSSISRSISWKAATVAAPGDRRALHTIALDLVLGASANTPALVENAVGLALYRRYEPTERLIESFICPN